MRLPCYVPDATTLFKWNYYIKEVIGYGVYYLSYA